MKKLTYLSFTSALAFISCLYSAAQTDYHITNSKSKNFNLLVINF